MVTLMSSNHFFATLFTLVTLLRFKKVWVLVLKVKMHFFFIFSSPRFHLLASLRSHYLNHFLPLGLLFLTTHAHNKHNNNNEDDDDDDNDDCKHDKHSQHLSPYCEALQTMPLGAIQILIMFV